MSRPAIQNGLKLLLSLLIYCSAAPATAAPKSGDFEIRAVDADTGQPLACRLHLKNARGIARKAPKLPFLHDHFVFDGSVKLTLREGNYTFRAECGPEYHTRAGHFTIGRFANDSKVIEMRRFVNMADEGWWSGDLHVHRRAKDLPLLLRADDVHVAQVHTWSQKKDDLAGRPAVDSTLVQPDGNRFFRLLAGRDVRGGGGLAYFQLPAPLEGLMLDGTADPEYPPAVQLALQARKKGEVWIDAETPLGWDLPVWIAHGVVDSIRLANYRFASDRHVDSEPHDRPRDKSIYAGADGLGRWSDQVYYHLLNCGLRIPPTAGSGSGDVNNPVGYHRVYVYCGKEFSYERWWEGLRAGRVVVTSGPLLRPMVEGQPPGHIFRGEPGKKLRLQIELQLATKDKIEYLEVVQDGTVEHIVRLEDYAKRAGRLPHVEFERSGWFLVRAVTNAAKTYRFASSGAFYVQIGDKPRVSRRSAQFFLDWVFARARSLKIEDARQRREVIGYHRAARDFWQELVDTANAP